MLRCSKSFTILRIFFQVIRTIGLSRTPVSKRSTFINSGATTPRPNTVNEDIAILDKLLTSLLSMKDRTSSQRGTPRSSQLPVITELRQRRRSESWPDRIYEDSVVRGVINSLRASKRSSQIDEPFMTPK